MWRGGPRIGPLSLSLPRPEESRRRAEYGFGEYTFKHRTQWVFSQKTVPGRVRVKFTQNRGHEKATKKPRKSNEKGPNTVFLDRRGPRKSHEKVTSKNATSNEKSSDFCPHRVSGKELSEFLSAYYLFAEANSPSFSRNSPRLPKTQWGSVCPLLRKSTLETVFRPFPRIIQCHGRERRKHENQELGRAVIGHAVLFVFDALRYHCHHKHCRPENNLSELFPATGTGQIPRCIPSGSIRSFITISLPALGKDQDHKLPCWSSVGINFQSRKCAINNFWTKKSAGVVRVRV